MSLNIGQHKGSLPVVINSSIDGTEEAPSLEVAGEVSPSNLRGSIGKLCLLCTWRLWRVVPAEVFIEVGVEARNGILIQTRTIAKHPTEVELKLPERH